ncbi:MAG: hypothetical protein QNJ68_19215 [Microcoleaceae cyanobacterium MO_207.B10]|nr:hypothetical protein [Microcoleaceae cyanobacterium MO_207.B10]
MNIVCISVIATIIILSDEIINGKLQLSRRLFKWIEKIGDRSQENTQSTVESE